MIVLTHIHILHIIIIFHVWFYSHAICFFNCLIAAELIDSNVLEHVQLENSHKLSIKMNNWCYKESKLSVICYFYTPIIFIYVLIT